MSTEVQVKLSPAVVCALAARIVRGDFSATHALEMALRVLGDEPGDWQDKVRGAFRWYLGESYGERDGRDLRHFYPDAWHDGDMGDIPLDAAELVTYRLLRELFTGEGAE